MKTINIQDLTSLQLALDSVESATGPKRQVLELAEYVGQASTIAQVGPGDLLDSVADGMTENKIDSMSLKVISFLMKYITPAGLLILLAIGIFYLGQLIRSQASTIIAKFQSVIKMISPGYLQPFLFHDTSSTDTGALVDVFENLEQLVFAAFPMFGIVSKALLGSAPLASTSPSSSPTYGNIANTDPLLSWQPNTTFSNIGGVMYPQAIPVEATTSAAATTGSEIMTGLDAIWNTVSNIFSDARDGLGSDDAAKSEAIFKAAIAAGANPNLLIGHYRNMRFNDAR